MRQKHWRRALAVFSPAIITKIYNKIRSLQINLVMSPLPSGNQKARS